MYDVKKIIEGLGEKYNNAIPVFAPALWAYEAVSNESPNFEKFVSYLPAVVGNADFFKWHEGIPGALRRFCHICLVDPTLVEVYLGMPFEEAIKP